DLGQHLVLGDLAALVVAGGERGEEAVDEEVGGHVTAGDAPAQGAHAGTTHLGVELPNGRRALLDVAPGEVERQEGDVPGRRRAAARRRTRQSRGPKGKSS